MGSLAVRTTVDGDVRQDGNTKDMIFTVAELVAYISSYTTLLPGDVILTGTPEGVGPMEAGQEVTIEIEGIGALTNPVASATGRRKTAATTPGARRPGRSRCGSGSASPTGNCTWAPPTRLFKWAFGRHYAARRAAGGDTEQGAICGVYRASRTLECGDPLGRRSSIGGPYAPNQSERGEIPRR